MARAKKSGKWEFLKGAAWIAVGGFVAKLIGALYRIPLTNLIGGRGLGLYQMVYPVYCLLLTVSATGIPSSIAKLTAERIGKGESDKQVFTASMRLFLIIGLCGTALMAIVAPFLAEAQGSKEVLGGYYALAAVSFSVKTFVLLELMVRVLGIPLAIAKPIAEVIMFAINIIIQKVVIFKNKNPKD